jgi:hypothetical protein
MTIFAPAARLAALGTACLLSGCASHLVYNEVRDNQAKAAKTAASEVNLVATVATLEQKYAALSDLEIQGQQSRNSLSRNLRISMVASSEQSLKSAFFDPLVGKRFSELTGASEAKADAASQDAQVAATKKYLEDIVDRQALDEETARKLSRLTVVSGLKAASCDEVAGWAVSPTATPLVLKPEIAGTIPAARRGSTVTFLTDLLQHCKKVAEHPTNTLVAGTVIAKLAADAAAAEKRVTAFRAEVLAQKKLLADAKKEYDDAVDATKPNESLTQRMSAAAQKLADKTDKLGAALAKVEDGAKLANAQAKLEALETWLGALASGTTDPAKMSESERHAVAVARLIPAVADEADKLFKEAAKPRITPVLLALEQQRLIVEGLQTQQAIYERMAAMQGSRLAAARSEALALAQARYRASCSEPDDQRVCARDMTLTKLQSDGTWKQRRRIYEAFAFYFDDAYQARFALDTATLKATNMNYEIQMAQSKSAALRWDSLITNISAVLAEHYAAGLKPEQIAEFLKGIGLLYIGKQAGK